MTILANPAINRPECYNFSWPPRPTSAASGFGKVSTGSTRPGRAELIEGRARSDLRANADDRDLSQSASGARLRDRDPLSRVHVRLPENRTARLRRDPHHLRPRRSLHRAEGAEVLHDRLPQPRHLLRGGHQPDPRRSGRRLRAAPDDGGRRFLGARRDHDDGDGDVTRSLDNSQPPTSKAPRHVPKANSPSCRIDGRTRRSPRSKTPSIFTPSHPRDIPSVVEEYIRAAHERGLREVRLIHGRGKGVQRGIVQARSRSIRWSRSSGTRRSRIWERPSPG